MKQLRIYFLLATILTVALGGCNSSTSTDNGEPNSLHSDNDGGKTTTEKPVGSSATDFATFFNESLVGRDNNNVEDALAAIIHPEMGVFLIYKPGAIERPTHCKDVQELKDIRISIVEEFTSMKTEAKEGELPFFDCDTYDKNGTYYKTIENNGLLETTYKRMAESMYIDLPAEELALAKKGDAAITKNVVNTEASLQLGFGQIDGKWYLISVDIAIFDCGA